MAVLLVLIAVWTILGLSCALLFFDLGFELRHERSHDTEEAGAGHRGLRHAEGPGGSRGRGPRALRITRS